MAHWRGRLARALPSQCRICRAWPAQPFCQSCVARFARPVPRCQRCALPLYASVATRDSGDLAQTVCGACVTEPPPLHSCWAAVGYAWPWANCIMQSKFGGQPALATALARLLHSAPWVELQLDQCDLLVPVPLFSQRLRWRGFNQALLLARQLAPHKTRADLLLRIRDTAVQSNLPRDQRLRNLVGAFALEPLLAHEVRGQRVLLVDDVMTSGASLHAAAAALLQGGAAQVSALVVARTDLAVS
jgi:ComF family protein